MKRKKKPPNQPTSQSSRSLWLCQEDFFREEDIVDRVDGEGEGGYVGRTNVGGVEIPVNCDDASAAGSVDGINAEGRGGGVGDEGGQGGHIRDVEHVRRVVELGDDVVVKDEALVHGAQIRVCVHYASIEGGVDRDERRGARRVCAVDEALESLAHVGSARQLQEGREVAGLRQDLGHVGSLSRRKK